MRVVSFSTLIALVAVLHSVAGTPVDAYSQSTTRLLQFGDNHREWVSVEAITLLESLRSFNGARPVSVEALRAANPVLSELSDLAISVIQRREGYRTLGPGYLDVTDAFTEGKSYLKDVSADAVVVPTYPTPNPSAHPEIAGLLAKVSAAELKSIVTTLSTQFATRYYRSASARQSSLWIQSTMASILGNSSVSLTENTFDQPNVIGRIPGTGTSQDVVIIGGHLDSTCGSCAGQTPAPGADDDASGVAVVLAVLRILKEAGWKGKYAVEGHAYAGEEGGLLGSQKVATSYKNAGKTVRGMLQLEMIGWQPNTSGNSGKSSTITVLSDPITQMSSHMTSIVSAYVPTAERRSTKCGYGCSDHQSFYDAGYPVVCIAAYGPNDSNLNPNYHTTRDTVDKINFDRAADFVKATLAWVVEVAS
ncbi:hypothetical protein BOTBODRAFT_26505 [Botryobasidium botryosum FD-172 SS1]|uniref:Peptide hydrolase n=1 Tax=Botryobasidium botryosum (strain FD-172 SS1) TaxID=930990 RepID=A0A067MY00_BOTB1|nr:hypothetical protein BOTBODRAFT_26505 [Botryobasidium botryosum FD-172 SS1]